MIFGKDKMNFLSLPFFVVCYTIDLKRKKTTVLCYPHNYLGCL
jgi:hypothetical protein